MMNKSEFLALVDGCPPEQVAAFQEDVLRQFLVRTRGAVSYYGNQFEAVIADETSFFDRWREMPFVDKNAIRDEPDRLTVAHPPRSAGAVTANQTSGVTGTPTKFLLTQHVSQVNLAMNARIFRTWNMDGDKTLMVMKISHTGGDTDLIEHRHWHPLGGEGLDLQISSPDLVKQRDQIAEIKPAYLKCYPAILAGLCESVSEGGQDMQLELILSGGSNLSDEVRDSCLDVFGSRIVDLYGTAEVGLIAYQCPDCEEYHMCFENNFTEIIKDNGQPAEPGEQGRVVVTTFRNDAMPLVRFEIGDYAERGYGVGPCANQPFTLRRIIGRSKMLFMRPDGSKYWPRIGHEAMVPAGVKRYRCIQLARNTIEFLYLPVDDQGADETAIFSALRHFLGTDIEFKIREVGDEEDLYHPKKLIFECMI